MIVVGIDPHKQTHTAVAVDAGTGRVLGELTVKARTKGFELLVGWARDLGATIGSSPSRTVDTSPGIWSGT